MQLHLRPPLLTLAALCCALAASPARAQDADTREQARQLYENGATLYEEGEYDKAIKAWEQSYALSHEPALLYNIANALERLGRIREAIDELNEYRIYAPAEEKETLDRRLRAMERRLADEPPAAPPPVEPAPEPQPEPAPPRPTRHPLRTAGVVLGALGVGSAGAGAGLYASASRQADLALDACVEGANGWLCASQADAPASRSRALASGGHATWAVAGALIATSVVTLALDSTTTGASLAPFPLPGGGGLLLHVPL